MRASINIITVITVFWLGVAKGVPPDSPKAQGDLGQILKQGNEFRLKGFRSAFSPHTFLEIQSGEAIFIISLERRGRKKVEGGLLSRGEANFFQVDEKGRFLELKADPATVEKLIQTGNRWLLENKKDKRSHLLEVFKLCLRVLRSERKREILMFYDDEESENTVIPSKIWTKKQGSR